MVSTKRDIANHLNSAFEDMCFLIDKYAPWSITDVDNGEVPEEYAKAVEDAKAH